VTGPIDPCVLREPCWLEEHLDSAGVADTDWSHHIPDEVIAVVQAMHRAGATDEDIAAHFAAARAIHAEVAERNATLEGDPFPPYPLGGAWEPTPDAVAQVLDAPGRRERRKTTRPVQIARQRTPQGQPGLFDLEAS
jgi:hypothetical protein